MYDEPWPYLADLNCTLIALTRTALGITTPVIRDDVVAGAKEGLLAAICEAHGGTAYLSGHGAHDYMTEERVAWLAARGLGHHFAQASLGPDYPYAALHYVFTIGATGTRDLLRAAAGSGVGAAAAASAG